jgi:PII-like signaling protein
VREDDMLTAGPAKRVTISIGENAHRHGEPLYLAVLNYLFDQRVWGATVSKGVAGFGPDHRLHTTRILEISENLPITITFVETADALGALLPRLLDLVGEGLVDVQDTTILKAAARDAKA